MRKMYLLLSSLALMTVISASLYSQNLKQISHDEGLTNNAVFTLFQDPDGYIWVGSCDGLSIYFGQRVHQVTFHDGSSLGGYLVEQFASSENGDRLWARTEHGLKSWNRSTGLLRDYPQFTGSYQVASSKDGTVMVMKDNDLYFYDPSSDTFIPLKELSDGEMILDFGCDEQWLWRITPKGIFRYSWPKIGEVRGSLSDPSCLYQGSISSSISRDGRIYITEEKGAFSYFDIVSGRRAYLVDLSGELDLRGRPSGVVEMGGDLFISFSTKGVLRFRSDVTGNLQKEDIGLNVGVFDIVKDRLQPVIWVATDGQGFYQYWEGPYSVKSVQVRDVSLEFGSPVRALYVDRKDRLWIGTKGSGIFIRNRSGQTTGQKWVTTANSGLGSNLVYVFSESRYGGFWIGTEDGLDFYDERADRIIKVDCDTRIRFVHAVEEEGDSLVWIATVGDGIWKASVKRSGSRLSLGDMSHFDVDNGIMSSNYFFSMCRASDGTLWFGNRGMGLYRMGKTDLEPVMLSTQSKNEIVADIFSILENEGSLWIGTGRGLVHRDQYGSEKYYDKDNGLPNNTVHSLLSDPDRGVWVTTNEGLARLDTSTGAIERYGSDNGLTVEEFSDGASYCNADGTMYFGGVNGWVEIRKNPAYVQNVGFVPTVGFTSLLVKGKQKNPFTNLGTSLKRGKTVQLRPDENSFTAEWVVLDNINYRDYSYFYRFGSGPEGEWEDNGRSNLLSFTHLAPGNYTLSVKARNLLTGNETQVADLDFSIAAPWYVSTVARVIYTILSLFAITAVVLLFQRRSRQRQKYALEQMDRRHKEELYEEKLRFFTNVTHEFRTPLSLIYTPCERILSYEGADSYIKKYTQVIRSNTDRLNALIQEIIDYRKLESGHQSVILKDVNISDITLNYFHSFLDLAEQNNMTMEHGIVPGIRWVTDTKCYERILTNLITNALKYTKKGGIIRISLEITPEDDLQLRVYNTGKGISEADIGQVFNRYKILDNVEENRVSSITSRNGLGLSICKGLVDLLGGTVTVDSKVGEYAEFIVRLPRQVLSGSGMEDKTLSSEASVVSPIDLAAIRSELKSDSSYVIDRKGLPLVLFVDDNREILDLLYDSLTQYDVRTAQDAEEAMKILKTQRPDLIITDIMMPGTDGFSFTRQVKENKHTMNIPMIILSARGTEEDRVRALEVGADSFIDKPFSLNYLKAVIAQLLKSAGRSREYYGSSASAFQYAEGQLLSKEDKELLQRIDTYLDAHLREGDIFVESLASAVQLSTRALYRRFSTMNLPPPNEFIKERKMQCAAKMLLTSNLTIQEVLYECGFGNRAHFYKEFGRRFGMTPKEFRQKNRLKDESLS